MDVITYTDARANLKDVMDRVIQDRSEVIVTRRKGEAVVVVSLDEWNAISETLHLLQSPKNAARLRRSIAQLDAGKGTERTLIED
ncbi:type II toxin-antitoxin system Phd/YefM family antitoxin [Paragemmobacter ruber]|uniref:Antitoxin n=1 Tax=Paragemmobacter ruber TaxID=1985673 RepID=A0ABW9Y4B0_9RHOB|nr:type II toxin-antitoxin system prevent-host-death family antitoxin [Rhodobacter ruber]NBE07227.1 type II toxin-antitoxin system prevent-host-death family antitoxin [Rhodobacter ruber]